MNFMPGTVRRQGRVRGRPFAADAVNARAADGRKVVYGMRPEHLEMAGEGEGVPTGWWSMNLPVPTRRSFTGSPASR